jgi:stage II sporulation protein AA (anti-sigma F factor antagonist)
MKMDVINVENGITKLVLSGSMNVQGALDLEPQFNEIVKTTDKVIVDLKDVHFLTSRGMRILVMSARSLREKGGKLVLVNPQAEVERAMKIVGIDTIIPIAPDLSAAIALFR